MMCETLHISSLLYRAALTKMYHGRFIPLSAGCSTALSSTPGSAALSAAAGSTALLRNISPGAAALLLHASSPCRTLLYASALSLLNVDIRASHLLASETLTSTFAGPALEAALTDSPEGGLPAWCAADPFPVSSYARRCCRIPLADTPLGPSAIRCRAWRCRPPLLNTLPGSFAIRCRAWRCRPPLLNALPGPFAVRCRARRCRSLPVLS